MPDPPRLRIVVPRFAPEIVGGVETHMRRLAASLAGRGWQVDVWSTTAVDEATWEGNLPQRAETANGVSVQRFPVARRRRPWLFHQASRALFRLPVALRPEHAWLCAQGPYSPSLVRALAGSGSTPTLFIPYLYHPTVYGLPVAPHPRVLIPAAHPERPLHLRSVGRMIAAADVIWFSSHEEQELVEGAHPVARRIPSAVGNMGVEPRHGDAGRFRATTGIAGPFLLYGGRMTAGKGADILLEGFRRLQQAKPDARLVLAGDRRPDAAQPGVIALGRLDDDTWAGAMAAAAAVVVPSPLESLSLLALEAWADGRPALLNAGSPVLRGHARRGGGALTFGTAAELAAAAERLLDDAALADGLGSAGRAYVLANFRWHDVVNRLEGLLAAARERSA